MWWDKYVAFCAESSRMALIIGSPSEDQRNISNRLPRFDELDK